MDSEKPSGKGWFMRRLLLATLLTVLSVSVVLVATPIEQVDCNRIFSVIPKTLMMYPQNSAAFAQIYIAYSSVRDLIANVGVGDLRKPHWSTTVWNRESGSNNLNLTVDISAAAQYLPPSEENTWFLKVLDAVNGSQGQIEKFTIISGNQTFDSTSVPVAIYNSQASYSYIPGVPLELAISRRISIRDFPTTENYTLPEVSAATLAKILEAGYGASSWGRTAANVCGNQPLVIYVCNKTAVYRYNPRHQAVELFRFGDYRFSQTNPNYPGPGTHRAQVELFIVLDTSKFNDIYLGAMEAGAVVQNIYLEANSLGLGTVCVGGVNATSAHEVLGLPADEVVLLNMPLGYPTSWAFYNFTSTTPPKSTDLPEVRESSVLLDTALATARESHYWSLVPITPEEISQILWSAYGFSYLKDMRPPFWTFQSQHRTIASAYSYPLEIWMINSTGTYLYNPWDHKILAKSLGDKRAELAQATAASWVASSPMTLLAILNSTLIAGLGQQHPGRLDWVDTEIGSLVQNVLLESTAWGLVADWSRILNENVTRSVLGIAEHTDLRPIFAVTVGHPLEYQDKVLRNGNSYLLTISTNSTITNFQFDSLTSTESYDVEGANGTIGYSNVTIPKSLLSGNFNVQVDGISTYYSLTQSATDSFLYFTYKNTGHMIEISVQAVPEFTTWASYFTVFICATIVLMLVKRTRRIIKREDRRGNVDRFNKREA
jgi:nitroreductase